MFAMLRTIDKAGAVLRLFTIERPAWNLTEIAAETGLPLSSAHSLMSSLVSAGLLRSPHRGRYEVSWRVLELTTRLTRLPADIATVALPYIEKLGSELGENVHLAILSRWRVVSAASHPVYQSVNVTVPAPPREVDFYHSAVGRVLLAYRHPTEVRRFLFDGLHRELDNGGRIDVSDFLKTLSEVRGAGFARDQQETADGICCLAVPVFDRLRVVTASVGVMVPACRYAQIESDALESVTVAGREISDAISTAD